FGFGQKTGIDLPAEEKGLLRSPSQWSKISKASLAIGYEISVTPLQILQAINTIANKGVVAKPKIVKAILSSSHQTTGEPTYYRRIISESTAHSLTLILKKAVEEGTGQAARIKGYKVAGKTGTAQKFNPATGRYSSSSHTASFVGFVWDKKPLFSMIVVIDDPQGQYYGGQVSAPVWGRIASQILRYLGIPPQPEATKTIIAAKSWRLENR
ncbi:MAG: penicillin-binding transpeptidase domain-containing protein, partial [Candidatus Aminicenantales bacterium]